MARAAKSAALRLLAGDSDTDDEVSVVDDMHEDVAAVNASDDDDSGSSSNSGENNESDDDGDEPQNELYLGKDGTQWQIINEDQNFAGRAMQANILRPAPGLTYYANQRIRDNPVQDCFLLFFSADMIETMVGVRVGRPALGAPMDERKRGACSQCPVGEKKKCTCRCDVCQNFMCKEHTTTLCPPCANRQ